ncbi:MAG: hypothetical protein IPN63_13410 [Gammaproteobacteria bacterium]|nr:hypothetical protein [Gammaproteobacteria bacterium]
MQGDQQRLAVAYHRYCQALTLAVVPAALVLAFFADHLVLLWTRDAELTRAVAPLVSLLVIGNMLNGLMHLPYSLQLAHGWTPAHSESESGRCRIVDARDLPGVRPLASLLRPLCGSF